jgi:hypothetical protein
MHFIGLMVVANVMFVIGVAEVGAGSQVGVTMFPWSFQSLFVRGTISLDTHGNEFTR